VVPFGSRPPLVGVEAVADDHEHRHAVTPGVVQRHRSVLQADGAVRHYRHRLAARLGVAVRHAHRRLFVQTGEQLRLGIAAVVDERFVQAAEARARVGGDVFEAERLDDVDHEVRARALDDDVPWQQLLGLALGFRGLRYYGGGGGSGGGGSGAGLEEIATFHGSSSRTRREYSKLHRMEELRSCMENNARGPE
jgi:hypothetical protein